jgi:hypothetical protein
MRQIGQPTQPGEVVWKFDVVLSGTGWKKSRGCVPGAATTTVGSSSGVKDALTAEPGKLRVIVRSDLVAVEGCRPEPGDRRRMAVIKCDIVQAGHGHIMPRHGLAVLHGQAGQGRLEFSFCRRW